MTVQVRGKYQTLRESLGTTPDSTPPLGLSLGLTIVKLSMAPKRPQPKPRKASPSEGDDGEQVGEVQETPPPMLHQLPGLPDDPRVRQSVAAARGLAERLQFEEDELARIDERARAFRAFAANMDKELVGANKGKKDKLNKEALQLTTRFEGDRRLRLQILGRIGDLRRELLDAEDALEASVEAYHQSAIVRAPRTPSTTTGDTPKRPRTATQDPATTPTPPRVAKKKKSQRAEDSDDEPPAEPAAAAAATPEATVSRYGVQGSFREWHGDSPEWRGKSNPLTPTVRIPEKVRGVSGGVTGKPAVAQPTPAVNDPRLVRSLRSGQDQGEGKNLAMSVKKESGKGKMTPSELPADFIPPMARDAEQPCTACKGKGWRCYFFPPTRKTRKAVCGRCNMTHVACSNGKCE